MSIIPTAIVAGVWYHLARQGAVTQTIWLGLNILDSLRALRTTYPNGRNVGIRTRRKAMREAMLCWTAYVAIQQIGGIPDRLLSWLPLYPLVRTLFVSTFLLARFTFSEALHTSFIQPTLQHYENHIDLTLLLLDSIASLVFYFAIQIPFATTYSFLWRHASGILRSKGLVKETKSDVDTTDISLGSIVEGLDQDATTITIQDIQPTRQPGNPGSVRRQTKKLDDQIKKATPAVVVHPSATESKVTGVRPISPYTTHFKQLANIPKVAEASTSRTGNDQLHPVGQVSFRSKRSPAPTPELPLGETSPDVFGQVSHKASAVPVVIPDTTSIVGTKRKLPMSASSTTIATRRRMLESTKSSPVPLDKAMSNPLSQPPRRLPIARDANVPRPRPTVPHALGKSKSTLELGSAKTSNPSLTLTARPTKSAPTRKPPPPAVLADQSGTKAIGVGAGAGAGVAKRIPSAADRAKVIRESKRREETIDVGEKRKSVRSIGPEGSKRTRVHIARD